MNFTEAIVLAVEKVKAWIQSGGVKWDHVSDKPFVKVGGDTLTWDGNTEGLVVLDIGMGNNYYKVSDVAPSLEELQNGVCKLSNGSEAPAEAMALADTVFAFGGMIGIVCTTDTTVEGITIPKGVFFSVTIETGDYVSSLTIPGYTGFAKEQIDPKVLPEALQFGKTTVQGDTLEWDGNTEGLVSVEAVRYKISDAVPTFADLQKGGCLTLNGEAMPFPEGGLSEEDIVLPDGIIVLSSLCIVPSEMAGVTSQYLEIAFPEAGIYVPAVATKLQLNGYTDFTKTEIKTIKPEYVPSKQAVFYSLGTDRYLYTDADLTTKATKADLVAAANKQILISLGGAVFFYAVTVNAQRDHADVYVGVPSAEGGLAFETYYTAEYTA